MELLRAGAQLLHVPHHGHLPAVLGVPQHGGGSPHGLGICVVSVIQNHNVPLAAHNVHPHFRGQKCADALNHLVRGHAQRLTHRRSHKGGVDHVAAQGGNVRLELAAGGLYPAAQMPRAVGGQVPGGVLQPLSLPHKHRGLGQRPPQRSQHGVVPVEDGQPLRLQMGENFALGLKDVLPAAQILNVGVPDVGNEGHVRLHQPAQIVDLPCVVHPQLHHAHLMAPLQLEQGEGHADVVVEVPLRFVDAEFCPQHGGYHVLGGGLAHRAGDGDKWDIEPFFVIPGQLPQGALGGAHLDVEFAGEIALPLPGGKAARRPRLQGSVNEGVAVEPLPLQGDEQAARLNAPAVGAHLAHHGVQILKLSQQGTVYRLYQLSQCQCLHKIWRSSLPEGAGPSPPVIFRPCGPPKMR